MGHQINMNRLMKERKMNKILEINKKLDRLVVFRSILETNVVKVIREMKGFAGNTPLPGAEEVYCRFVSELFKITSDISSFVNNYVMTDDNYYIQAKAAGKEVSDNIERAVTIDLMILSNLAMLTSERVISSLGYDKNDDMRKWLPEWDCTPVNIPTNYRTMIKKLSETGYGIFAKYHVFTYGDGELKPVEFPDNQSIDSLFGYERERDIIVRNTKALINGTGSSNMLLYGDAGTGKSSTIKAIANAYASQGLRMIEVKKNQLFELPSIIEKISANPLKFIIFIDDLSFTSNDDNFSALKAILEGGVSSFGNNIAVYATSNRRHLVKESMQQREGDDLYLNDTIQETMSLASRFGLVVTFSKPNKDEYLNIVKQLAEENELDIPEEELFSLAERHAIRCNGRSPRVAKQFIELQKNGLPV